MGTVFKTRHYLAVIANLIFVVGSLTSFFYHELLSTNFLHYINYSCIYLFSVTGLLLSKKLVIRSFSILTSGISLGKIIYTSILIELLQAENRRMLFLIICIGLMILHVTLWLAYDLAKKWKN